MSESSASPPPQNAGSGFPGSPTDAPILVRAGPWQMLLVEGELRYLTAGTSEAVRRIYAAVRDRFWNTIPGRLTGCSVERTGDGFSAAWESVHQDAEIDFVWRSTITGTPEGSIRWEFDGVARREFQRNRIGFCVLHPLATCRGRSCEVEHVSGEVVRRTFPDLIAPDQPVRGLHDYRMIRYDLADGRTVEIRFEGDTFEMEDQRNWTDASFKTYGTPQRIPLPATVREGDRIRQVVTVTLKGTPAPSLPPSSAGGIPAPLQPAGLSVGAGNGRRLPVIGLGRASHGRALDDRSISLLRALRLGHLRVDLALGQSGWEEVFREAIAEARALGTDLEVALHLPPASSGETLEAVAGEALAASASIARWLILEEGKPVASAATLARARAVLQPIGAPVGAGTDIDYFPLNNHRPAAGSADFIFCSLRPQAHNFDDAAIVENLAGQEDVVESALATFSPLPFVASPVTLRRRWFKGPPAPEGELPPMVDPRQPTLLGGGWLVGSLRALSQAGASSATWFETTGWRGVLEVPEGCPLPAKFPSSPGGAFPIYHVLRALAGWEGGEVVPVELSNPLALQGLLVRKVGQSLLLLANVTTHELPVTCQGTSGPWRLRVLDLETAAEAALDPENFHTSDGIDWSGDRLTLPAGAVALAVRNH